MPKTFYRQCQLQRGQSVTTSWLPEKFAKVSKFLKLKNKDGTWDDGWQVVTVGNDRMAHEEVIERSQDYKHQRMASDI